MRSGPAARPEPAVLAARVERVATEPDREDLERVHVRSVAGMAALLDEIQKVRRRARHGGPRLIEIGLFDRIAGRSSLQHRVPQAKREGARATLERVERRRPLSYVLGLERNSLGLVEAQEQRAREPRGSSICLFVVVLRRDANEVLDAELEIERVALRAVDHVGHRRYFEPTARLVEREATCTCHLAQRTQRSLHFGLVHAASPDRRKPLRERARGDRAAVARKHARGEFVPEVLSLEEQIRRGRGDCRQDPRLLLLVVNDRDELPREELQTLRG